MNCNIKCKICNEEHEDEKEFHKHIKSAHKIPYRDYYPKYEPKYDLYTREPIPFKSRGKYLSTNFINKGNLERWLDEVATDKQGREMLLSLLDKRKKEKNLKYAPCQVVLKSTDIPDISYFEKFFKSYEEAYTLVGLEKQFTLEKVSLRPIEDNFVIAIDTREQQPLEFKGKTVIMKCAVGDYTALSDYHANLFIDRKNPSDFIGTFTSGFERFTAEIELAKKLNSYVVVLVEMPLDRILGFDSTYLKKFTKATPVYVFSNVRKIMESYTNVQFLFVENRGDASACAEKILRMDYDAHNVDLQLLYDRNRA